MSNDSDLNEVSGLLGTVGVGIGSSSLLVDMADFTELDPL